MYVVQYSSTNLNRWYQRTQTLANTGPLERPDSSQNSVRDVSGSVLFTDNARMSAHSSTICQSERYKENLQISALECADIRALSVNKTRGRGFHCNTNIFPII